MDKNNAKRKLYEGYIFERFNTKDISFLMKKFNVSEKLLKNMLEITLKNGYDNKGIINILNDYYKI